MKKGKSVGQRRAGGKKDPASGETITNNNHTEPLSNFQDLSVTGRTDPNAGEEKEEPEAKPKKINITKAKLVKGEFLEITFNRVEKDATPTDVNEKHKTPVHPDLKAALKACRVHMAIICDYVPSKQIKNIDKYEEELVEKFIVNGVSIGGADGEEGVVITGHKINAYGQAVILNTPFTRFESKEGGYKFLDDLQITVYKVIEEVGLYMGGKHGEEEEKPKEKQEDKNQLKMEFTAGEEN